MKVIPTDLLDVYLLEPQVFGDYRGWFMESWSQKKMEEAGLFYSFLQDNHSYSVKAGTLRGLHFQKGDACQAKLVRCGRGAVVDVAVDLRKGSPTYLKWSAFELTAENKFQVLIPRGFAHGFLTLTDDVEFLYKADNYFVPEAERSILWSDPDIGINWKSTNPIVSEKDAWAPLLKDSDVDFIYYQLALYSKYDNLRVGFIVCIMGLKPLAYSRNLQVNLLKEQQSLNETEKALKRGYQKHIKTLFAIT